MTAEDIAFAVKDLSNLFIAQNGKNFSISALLHAIQMIKGAQAPFDVDEKGKPLEFYGIQPRKVMLLLNKYKKWLAGKTLAIEKKIERAKLEKEKASGKPMPSEVQEALRKLVEKNEKEKNKRTSEPVKYAEHRTIRLIERVECWVVKHIAKEKQKEYFESLKNTWSYTFVERYNGTITETEFFELCAEQFLKEKEALNG